MERLFRSLKSEWVPSTGYLTAQEAQRDISHYLMHRYNWIRPHQFNDGLPPAVAEENSTHCPGWVDHYNMAIQMTAIGEESGSLDEMLSKVASYYEEEVDNAVDNLTTLMEPMIMAVLGVLVGGLIVAMYLPIFQLGNVVG